MTNKKLEVLTAEIRSWAKNYQDTSVTPLNALEERNAQKAECRLPLLISSSVTLLMLAPLFWFFSQTMFYKKREKEMELLRAMGAIESEMRGMYVRDGLIYAGLGALFTAILGGAGVVVIYRMSLGLFAIADSYFAPRFELEFPWIALAAGILISVVCAFCSSYIPYIMDKKRTVKRMTTFKEIDD
jgi:ABC-type lipoprotein release transport system permease subunit